MEGSRVGVGCRGKRSIQGQRTKAIADVRKALKLASAADAPAIKLKLEEILADEEVSLSGHASDTPETSSEEQVSSTRQEVCIPLLLILPMLVS